jgi:hypothetical protein
MPMPQRIKVVIIIMLAICFYSNNAFSQEFVGTRFNTNKEQIKKSIQGLIIWETGLIKHQTLNRIIRFDKKPLNYDDCSSQPRIPFPTIYYKEIGFFCKQELKFDKLTLLPIRFRLGSLDYVNWMEQKPNAIKPGK